MTYSRPIRDEGGARGTFTDHQIFLQTFSYGMWREYSAMAHAGFDGLMESGVYLMRDALPHDSRAKLDEKFPKLMSLHLFRGALILLCMVTEIQAYFGFSEANINQRIQKVWEVLLPVFEVRELFDERYARLMRSKGVYP
jgi:hypothetical protein